MLLENKNIHFIGIGGSGMNPLAAVLVDMGYTVSGSDVKENIYTLLLKEKGVQIFYGHDPSNIRLAEIVVLSSAIKANNIELQEAINQQIPVIKRAEMLSYIMDQHNIRLAVAGTHGKTTVTSFISHYLCSIGRKPTYIIGAPLKNTNIASQYGQKDFCVAEADESDRSFLFLNPNIIVITNIEEEHMDQFEDLKDILDTFTNFTKRLDKTNNLLILNGDDENIKKINVKGKKVITYGFNEGNTVQAKNLTQSSGRPSFDVYVDGEIVATQIKLNIPGKHNIENCLTVFALAKNFNLPFSDVIKSFKSFEGASRRFHKAGEVNNIMIFDDYAHHPTEIKATLEAAKEYNRRIIAIFQPHRYSRFAAFYKDFVKNLSIADKVFFTDVYAAGEDPGKIIAKDILPMFEPNKAEYIPQVSHIASKVANIAKPGDLIITLGAGDVTFVSKEIVQLLNMKKEDI
ncbi:MAG: UDP-N-acetylmuramate--L-alanine ligase [Candidatus Riflemargulisbacteria bacterium]